MTLETVVFGERFSARGSISGGPQAHFLVIFGPDTRDRIGRGETSVQEFAVLLVGYRLTRFVHHHFHLKQQQFKFER